MKGSLYALAGACCLLTLLGFLDAWNWLCDLAVHFRVQYSAVLLLTTPLFLVRKRWLVALGCAVCLCLNLWVLLPYYRHRPPQAEAGLTIRVLAANVLIRNTQFERVRSLIAEEQPDIVVLQELNPAWYAQLESLKEVYPYASRTEVGERYGIGLWSKFPIRRAEKVKLAGASRILVTRLEINGQEVAVVASHPPSPTRPGWARARTRELIAVGEYVGALNEPRLLVGDLNTTPWSYPYRRMLQSSRLKDARQGLGLFPSWPAQVGVLRIPIDHILYSPEFQIVERVVLPSVGSDHLPIRADFVLTAP